MNKLLILEEYAFNEGIEILNGTSPSKRKGSCMTLDDQSLIFLNNSQIANTSDKRCVLAYEIGHLQTGTLLEHETYLKPKFAKWLKFKNHHRAKKWAIEKILPYEDIQRAINNYCMDDYELAEELDVSVEFLQSAIEYYTNRGMYFESPED